MVSLGLIDRMIRQKGEYVMSNNRKKQFLRMAGRVFVLFLIVVMLSGCGDKSKTADPRQRPVENFFNGFRMQDAELYLSAFPKEAQEVLLEKYGMSYFELLVSGEPADSKIDIEVIDEKKLDKEQLERYLKYLEEGYGVAGEKVREYCVLVIKINNEDEQDKNHITEFPVFLYKGEWYMDPGCVFP